MKKRNKKYTPRPVRKPLFFSITSMFGSTIEWFDDQLGGKPMALIAGVPQIISAQGDYAPAWLVLDTFIDWHDLAVRAGHAMPLMPHFAQVRQSLEFDSLVPQSTFEQARAELVALRDRLLQLGNQATGSLSRSMHIMLQIRLQQARQREAMKGAA